MDIRDEGLELYAVVYDELYKLGVDLLSAYINKDKIYEENVSKAIKYLVDGKEIPTDVRRYLLSHKVG